MTTIINPRRINRTIVVERDSRTLTARVIDALDAPNGMAEMLADAEAARDDAQAAQAIAETARDESVIAGHQAAQAAADASASEANAASSEGVAVAAASDAVSARDAAVTARDAAQAAQGLAETARAGAETARSGAESAQAAAGTHATNARTFRNQAQAAQAAAATSAGNAASSATTASNAAIATAADRVQTGLDKAATAADRVQTGLDKAATAADRTAAETAAALANGMPIGTIMHFAADTPPAGWLVCDGTAVTSLYPDLRSFLLDAGSPYGLSGADPRLPDLRGEFLRGWDGGRGVDAGRAFGSAQGDAVQDHSHLQGDSSYSPRVKLFGSTATPNTTTRPGGNDTGTIDTPYTSKLSDAVGSANARYADETRPRNIALLPCIRAYASVVNVPGQADLDNILQQVVQKSDYASEAEALAGVATDKVMSPARVRASLVSGYSWRDLLASRAWGTSYQNSTQWPLIVSVEARGAGTSAYLEVSADGVEWVPAATNASDYHISAQVTVPPGHRYRLRTTGTTGRQFNLWSEYRRD